MNIQEYLSTKVKNSKALVTELKSLGDLFTEVQADYDNNAEYHTLDVTKGMDTYKKGFINFNKEINSIALIGCNNAEDFAELLGDDIENWKFLNTISKGATRYHNDDEIYVRLW